MQQSLNSSKSGVVKGSLLILAAIAVGIGSSLGLNYFLPERGPGISKVAAQAEESSEEETAAEASTADSDTAEVAAPAEETASTAEPAGSSEPEPAPEPTPEPVAPQEPDSSSANAEMQPAEVAAAEEPADAEVPTDEPVSSMPEPSSTALAESSEPVAPTRSSKTPTRSPPPPAAQVLRSWWSPSGSEAFGVQYVGQVQGQPALAVLFSQDVPSSAGANLKLVDEEGKEVAGDWQSGKSSRLLVRSALKPGRYTLLIDSQIASADGKTLPAPLRGPVYIQ